MALPALLTRPAPTWTPGDPLYDPPQEHTPCELERLGRHRDGGGRPMHWTAAGAVPGPWTWLCGPAATERGSA